MNLFLSYVLLGLSLAAPIGPVNAAQLDKGLKYGFWHSWCVGIGAFLADGIYLLLVYIGVIKFIELSIIQTFLLIFGSFVLIYTGIESIINTNPKMNAQIRKKEPLYMCFFSGFVLSLSNPLTILFWLGIYGSVLAKTTAKYNHFELFISTFAIFIGLFIWDVTMAAISSSFKKFFTNKFIFLTSFLSGICLIGFGIYFGSQAIKSLFS